MMDFIWIIHICQERKTGKPIFKDVCFPVFRETTLFN